MAVLVWAPLLLPLIVAAAAVARRRDPWTRRADVAAALVVLGSGAGLLVAVTTGGPITAARGVLRVDSLSAYLLTTIGAVAVVALWGGAVPRTADVGPDGRFTALLALFLAAMSLAVLADNLGVLWVAVEATTITTAFLVGHHGGRRALEAAWKYVVLGSVGVAIAFLGLVLLYAATRAAGDPTLSWSALAAGAPGADPRGLDPHVVRIGVALAALGFATKAGLAPMHSWLPDAHSQAPAPVSGLMSGVLLSVAFAAILRVQAVSDAVLGPAFMRGLLVVAGLLSLAVSAALILAQRDYKRLLAYSSIEHMGLLALGAAAGGPLARTAVLLHVLGHGLVKATMFVLAGRILAATGSSRVADVRHLLARRPDLAVPFLAGTAALLAFPPFGLFFTEVAILLACWQRGLGWAAAVALALLLVAFAGLGRHVLAMTLHGPPSDGAGPPDDAAGASGEAGAPDDDAPRPGDRPGRRGTGPQVPLALALGLTALLPFAAWPLTGVLADAVAALGGRP